MPERIELATTILASPSVVWEALTIPELMRLWMAEAEVGMEVITDWQVGGSIVIKGFHHVAFENSGTVLAFEPPRALHYNYLSSLSKLPDRAENRTSFTFELEALGDRTLVRTSVDNFPTMEIYKHHALYWRTTMEVLRAFVENEQSRKK